MPQVTFFADENSSPNNHYFEMKAGKMEFEEGTNGAPSMVTAIPDPGKISLTRKNPEELIKFEWKNLVTNKTVDSFLIMPGEVDLHHVKKIKDARVFALRFKQEPERKMFYWAQDIKTDKDEENFKMFSSMLENGFTDVNDLLNKLEPAQIVELLNTIGVPSTAVTTSDEIAGGTPGVTSKASTNVGSNGQIQLQDLQKVLASMPLATATNKPKSNVNLNDVMKCNKLTELLSDPASLSKLAECLPPNEVDDTNLVSANIRTPFFQHAVKMFSEAFNEGDVEPILTQFGFGNDAKDAAAKVDWKEFAEALEAETQQGTIKMGETASGTSPEVEAEMSEERKEDEEGKMDVDK